MIKTAIIIVAYNAEPYLPALLSSLANLNYPKNSFGVFVIDNNSSDQTLPKLRDWQKIANDFNLEVIASEKNLGFAAGNNLGIKLALKAGYDYIVLLNQDMRLDREWLKELTAAADRQPTAGAVQAMMLL